MVKDDSPTPNEEAEAEDKYLRLDFQPPMPRLRGLDWPYTMFDLMPDRS